MQWRSTGPLAAILLAAAGCGAKTGLNVPDVVHDNAAIPDAPRPPCIDVIPDAGLITVNLETRPQLSVADIVFVIDSTGSMQQEIDNIKSNLQRTIVPAIQSTIGDVQYGIVTFRDFPLTPYGEVADATYTYRNASNGMTDVAHAQAVINEVRANGGGDNAEASVEALYQIATGDGYHTWIGRTAGCPSLGVGGLCFRRNAQPIAMLFTDAPAHNGPNPANNYNARTFTSAGAARGPHSYADMLAAVNNLHLRVMGINSGTAPYTGRSDLVEIARATGAVGDGSNPLVFDIGADGHDLDTRVVTAVQTFTAQVRFNASARVTDVDPLHPVTTFVRGLRPLSALPAGQVEGFDGTTFFGVVPGTRLTFAMDLDARLIPRRPETQRFRARVQFLGDGRPNLGYQDVDIVVPGTDGGTCEDPGGRDGGMDGG
jgi:hypothetical protein